ncbi:hypothetical protein H4683_000246 [Filibacter limicola]|uniref:Uncharacterized protein n=1 Tax=Sporosarcina limicola TaxID=34101 RepID=A0A927MHC8_9BACL|nr:hypothetical protein [Sporosarcina limicola]
MTFNPFEIVIVMGIVSMKFFPHHYAKRLLGLKCTQKADPS